MNIIDKLYTEWAWRTESGIPDIKNPKDKAILNSILSELEVPLQEDTYILEADGNIYDQVIALKLFQDASKISDIPGVNKKYSVGKDDKVDTKDLSSLT